MVRRALLVGLTGGIGSGKSTVAAGLRARGAVVVDADALAREVVESDRAVLDALAERFGPDVRAPGGELDRALLARRAFVDDVARAELEGITHPPIRARLATAVAEARDRAGDGGFVVLDHPLLIESGAAADCDEVVVVTAPADERVRRLVEDRGMDPDDVRARMRAQLSDAQRCAGATYVIANDRARADLDDAIEALADWLTQRVRDVS